MKLRSGRASRISSYAPVTLLVKHPRCAGVPPRRTKSAESRLWPWMKPRTASSTQLSSSLLPRGSVHAHPRECHCSPSEPLSMIAYAQHRSAVLLVPFVPVLLIAAAGNAKRLSAMLPFARALVPSLDRMMALETRVIRPALAPRSARFVSFCRRSAWRSTGQGHRCQLRARRLRVDGHSAGHTAPELPDPHPAWSCPSSSSFCLLLPDRQTHSESPSPDLHCGQANYSACDTSSLQSPALPGPILRPEQTASF